MIIMPAAVTHDTEARFKALHTQYQQPVQRRIQVVLKPSNSDLIEEVEQDTWLKVWRALPTTPTTNLHWCLRIARHAAIDALRVHYHLGYKRTPSIESLEKENRQGVLVYYEEIEGTTPDLADLMCQREELDSLLARMSVQERRVLFLFQAGYQAKELAPFALSEDEAYGAMRTLRDRMRRARKREQASSV